MKKQIATGLFALLSAFAANAQYGFAPPVGIATVTPGSPATINLTTTTSSNTSYLAGAIWNYNTVDFNHSFTLDYDVYIDTLYGSGADGYCAVFKQNNSLTSIGATAGYIGYYYGSDFLSNAFAIEFDDFNNAGGIGDPLPYYDHIMIAKNGSFATGDILAGPVPILPTSSNIKDKQYHHYKIEWICSSNTLNVYVDTSKRVTTTTIDYRTLFTNPSAVTWGFTGGVGSSGSNHIMKNVVLRSGAVCAQPCKYNPSVVTATLVSGQTQISITPNASNVLIAGYMWDFGDGTGTIVTTAPGATHSYSTTGAYTITVSILGYNTTTGQCCSYTYRTTIQADGGSGRRPAAINTVTENVSGIKVYPNPTGGKINIATNGFKFTAVQVININGSKVMELSTEATDNKDVDLRSLSNGMYILQLVDEAGQLHVQKVTLQN